MGIDRRRAYVLVTLVVAAGFFFVRGKEPEPTRAAAVVEDALLERQVRRHAEVLREAGRESGVDPYLLAGLMMTESSGRVGVVSSAGRLGLFQLWDVNARWRAEELGLPPPTREALLSDPLLNARLGADTMAWLLATYDGNELRALCSYNAGTRRMKQIVDAEGGWEEWLAERELTGGSEILEYALKVLRFRDSIRERGLLEHGE